MEDTLQELANRTGLRFEADAVLSAAVLGTYRGRSLCLDTVEDPKAWSCLALLDPFLWLESGGWGGGGTTKFTRIVLGLRTSPPGVLSLKRKSAPETRDQPFDQQFRVRASPESFASQVLASASLRERLLEIKGSIKIDSRRLVFKQRGIERNTDRLQLLFDLLCDLAEEVEKATAMMKP